LLLNGIVKGFRERCTVKMFSNSNELSFHAQSTATSDQQQQQQQYFHSFYKDKCSSFMRESHKFDAINNNITSSSNCCDASQVTKDSENSKKFSMNNLLKPTAMESPTAAATSHSKLNCGKRKVQQHAGRNKHFLRC